MNTLSLGAIDFIVSNSLKSEISLVITGHMAWDVNPHEYLFMLQEKFNKYLSRIESGKFGEIIWNVGYGFIWRILGAGDDC